MRAVYTSQFGMSLSVEKIPGLLGKNNIRDQICSNNELHRIIRSQRTYPVNNKMYTSNFSNKSGIQILINTKIY